MEYFPSARHNSPMATFNRVVKNGFEHGMEMDFLPRVGIMSAVVYKAGLKKVMKTNEIFRFASKMVSDVLR